MLTNELRLQFYELFCENYHVWRLIHTAEQVFWILIFIPKELHVHCVQGLGDVLAWYLQQNKSHILRLDEIDDLYVWYYIQQCEFYGPLPNHLASIRQCMVKGCDSWVIQGSRSDIKDCSYCHFLRAFFVWRRPTLETSAFKLLTVANLRFELSF